MLSNPAALPFFKVFSAFFTSALVIGPVLMASGGASGRSVRIYGSGTVFGLYEKDEKQSYVDIA